MIKVTVNEGLIKVKSPFNREFVSFARMRNGKWSDGEKVWMFDIRDEFAIRSALIDIYGTDDYKSCKKVNVRVSLNHFDIEDEFILFGRQLLRRKYRDRYVEVGDGVIIISGGFPESGGSGRYPKISAEENTVIEIRDVPQDIALRVRSENEEAIELLGSVDIEALKEEKKALLKRIEQIEQTIAELEDEKGQDDLADLYD